MFKTHGSVSAAKKQKNTPNQEKYVRAPVFKTHSSVSAAKKQKIRETKKNTCGRTPVCYLRDRSNGRFQPIITQKLWHLFLPNLHILVPSYAVPYIPNLK